MDGTVYVTYDPSASVAVGDRPAGTLQLAAHPNPVQGMLSIRFTLPTADPGARLAVYDLSGRLVRTLDAQGLVAGDHTVAWDLRRDNGAQARAGVFFLRLTTSHGAVAKKVLVLD